MRLIFFQRSLPSVSRVMFSSRVLSHGKRVQGWDLVMGVNGVDRTDIQEKFADSSCPNLTGKPKLFFYQACRDQG